MGVVKVATSRLSKQPLSALVIVLLVIGHRTAGHGVRRVRRVGGPGTAAEGGATVILLAHVRRWKNDRHFFSRLRKRFDITDITELAEGLHRIPLRDPLGGERDPDAGTPGASRSCGSDIGLHVGSGSEGQRGPTCSGSGGWNTDSQGLQVDGRGNVRHSEFGSVAGPDDACVALRQGDAGEEGRQAGRLGEAGKENMSSGGDDLNFGNLGVSRVESEGGAGLEVLNPLGEQDTRSKLEGQLGEGGEGGQGVGTREVRQRDEDCVQKRIEKSVVEESRGAHGEPLGVGSHTRGAPRLFRITLQTAKHHP